MFELLDERLREAFLMQRNTAVSGGKTPLHDWLSIVAKPTPQYRGHSQTYFNEEKVAGILKMMICFSGGKERGMINSASDTPLHILSSARSLACVQVLLEHNRTLLYCENATGYIPYELAHDVYTALKTKGPPTLAGVQHASHYVKQDERRDEELIWELCRDGSKEHPENRELGSLGEANDGARRFGYLAASKKGMGTDLRSVCMPRSMMMRRRTRSELT